MQNFQYLGWLDTFAVVAYLHKLQPTTWKGVKARGETVDVAKLPTRSVLLRCHENVDEQNWLEDLEVRDYEELTKWKSCQRLLEQARKLILGHPGMRNVIDPAYPVARVMATGMPKQSVIAWHKDTGPYHERHLRFHIPLVTNPAVTMYSGNEQLHMPQGHLFWFNNECTHSAANWGLHGRVHLIFEMRRSDAPDGG